LLAITILGLPFAKQALKLAGRDSQRAMELVIHVGRDEAISICELVEKRAVPRIAAAIVL